MKIDVDGSGEIDYDEFIAAIVQQKITNYWTKLGHCSALTNIPINIK